jgi:hypothetical protein
MAVPYRPVFERYGRYEPEVAEALTEMLVSGTSTHNVGKVATTLLGRRSRIWRLWKYETKYFT